MISEQEIRVIAKSKGVAPRIIEKDYLIGLFLREIALDKNKLDFIFKGGTALKKCYFKDYRFSEDIDFTVTNRSLNDKEVLTSAIKRWCSGCNNNFGTTFRFFNIVLEREIYGQEAFKATIHYDGFEGTGKINIDLTFYEKIAIAPHTKLIKHPYSDRKDFGKVSLKVYCLEETMAEKLRAISFIQHYPRNRDLYDIWFINKTAIIDRKKIAVLFKEKCKFKDINPNLIKKINSAYLGRFRKSWQVQLGHQIKGIPPFTVVCKDFLKFIKAIIKIGDGN